MSSVGLSTAKMEEILGLKSPAMYPQQPVASLSPSLGQPRTSLSDWH